MTLSLLPYLVVKKEKSDNQNSEKIEYTYINTSAYC